MYDRMGHNAFEGGFGGAGLAVSVQKIFSASSVISLVWRRRTSATPTSRFRLTLELTLEEAVKGVKKTITFTHHVMCVMVKALKIQKM